MQIAPDDRTDLGERLGQMGADLQPPATVVVGQFWGATQEYFSAGGGTSFPQLIAKLGEAWEAVRAKIQDESGKLAKKLIDYLISDAADGEIGDKLGWITGLVATQLLLDFLTAGTTEVLKPLQVVAKLLNWPMELMGKAFKLIGKLGKYVVKWIKKLGGMVKDAAAGAFLAVKDALGVIGSKLVQFGEEIVARFSKFGKKASTAVHEGEKLGETGLAKAAQQEGKAVGKTKQALQKGEAKTAGETGKITQKTEQQELKEAEEAAKKEKQGKKADEEPKKSAQEVAEAPAVVAEARGIVQGGNALHLPLPVIMSSLVALKANHSWIKYFKPVAHGAPGHFEIHMIATDYDLGEVVVAEPPKFNPAKDELGSYGLTKAQRDHFRQLIDNPPAGKTADRMRFERNQVARKNRNLPDLPEPKWEAAKTQVSKNRQFGIDQENKAREGVKKFEKRLDLKNNNEGNVLVDTVKDPKTGKPVTTRPDSIGENAKKEVDFVHDHKTVTGKDKVVYNTSQIRGERELLPKTGEGKHVVSVSTNKPKLSKIPPEPRPSEPLGKSSTVYYTNPQGKVTHVWVVDETLEGGGFWSKVAK